jgi:hypothetical protein
MTLPCTVFPASLIESLPDSLPDSFAESLADSFTSRKTGSRATASRLAASRLDSSLVALAEGAAWSFFASVFSRDLITGISFSAGYVVQPAIDDGDLKRANEAADSQRLRRPNMPRKLNSTEVTKPSLFSVCSV